MARWLAGGCSSCRRSRRWQDRHGAGSDAVANRCATTSGGIAVGGAEGDYAVKAPTWTDLGRALIDAPRPKGARLRIAVDPPRR